MWFVLSIKQHFHKIMLIVDIKPLHLAVRLISFTSHVDVIELKQRTLHFLEEIASR